MTIRAACMALSAVVLSATISWASSDSPRLVRVELDPQVTVERLVESGFDVVEVRRGSHCVILELPVDRERLRAWGATTFVIDEDPGRTAAEAARAELKSRPRPAGRRVLGATGTDGVFRVQTLPPFGSGSMGGYWTLAEIKLKLDDLVASDVNDVVADKIDTLGTTTQGRPIWGLKLAKAVPGPDTRPGAFLNSLTHAREPAGMQSLLYFADDLVSKYGVDPLATYLLDHRVIYIVPVVNPDGYKLNEDRFFASGQVVFSYHRKNLRDTNGNSLVDYLTDGVDINRNYGYQWGGLGAATDPADETYRGSGPFSEPETQAQRDIVALLQPRTGISFHTWGDLYLHPWGFTPTATPDSMTFYELSDEITHGNSYQSGQGPRILYAVSGEFTDWCYGETLLKPKMYAWTPEVGAPGDGFWPFPSRLLPLAQDNLRPCYKVAAIAGPHVVVETFSLLEGALNRGGIAHLTLRGRNIGVSGQAGPGLTATLASLSAGASVIHGSAGLPMLGPFQSADLESGNHFAIAADDTVTLGRLLRFQVDFTAPDGYFSRDTVEVFCGTPTVILSDNASGGIGNWSTTGNWAITSGDPYQPDAYFADSPAGVYGNNNNASLTLIPTLDLSKSPHAYLLFDGRWDFESDIDCGVVEARRGPPTWVAMPGASTNRGLAGQPSGQPAGQPVYDGARRFWRGERVDLAAVAGTGSGAVNLRFRITTNNGMHFDGFRIDSIRVLTFDPAQQPTPVAVGDGPAPVSIAFAPPTPNPARSFVRLSFDLPAGGGVRLEALDLQGRRIRTVVEGRMTAGRYEHGWDLRDERGRAVGPGLYFLRLESGGLRLTRRVIVTG